MSEEVVGVEVHNPEEITDYENLILNLLGGAKPQHLSEEEVELLEEEHGENWFEEMGYADREGYERPNFLNGN